MAYGRAEGFAINDRSSSPTAATGLRGGWEHPLFGTQLRLVGTLDAVVLLTRTHYRLDAEDAWVTSRVGGALGIGIQRVFF